MRNDLLLRARNARRSVGYRPYNQRSMPTGTKTPPGAGRKKAQPWLRAFGLADAGRIPQAELDAVKRAVSSITEAQVAAERFAGPNVLGKALENLFPATRLAEQITAISNAHVGRLGAGWAEQFTKSHATGIKAWDGAGIAPGIAESFKASGAAAAWAEPQIPAVADIEPQSATELLVLSQRGQQPNRPRARRRSRAHAATLTVAASSGVLAFAADPASSAGEPPP